jgi:hypothetical protein
MPTRATTWVTRHYVVPIILATAAALAVGIALFHLAPFREVPAGAAAQPAVPIAQAPSAQGALSAEVIREGDTLRFWLTVSNPLQESLCNVRLISPHTPELKIDTNFSASGLLARNSCRDHSPALGGNAQKVAHELLPGQSVTVQGHVLYHGTAGSRDSTAVIGWESVSGISSQRLVILGRYRVESGGERLYDLGKDFGLPVFLLILGALWKLLEIVQEGQKRAYEADQESNRRIYEQELASKAETWRQMLPVSHDLATRYYMPLAGAVRGVVESLDGFAQETDVQKKTEQCKRAFYFLMLMARRCKTLVDERGGLYFKTRMGEALAAECWSMYDKRYFQDQGDRRAKFQHALEYVRNEETYNSFVKKLDSVPTGPLKDIMDVFLGRWEDFQVWVTSAQGKRGVAFLKVFRGILNYEMNRPYELWYGEPERLKLSKGDENLLMGLGRKIGKRRNDPTFQTLVKNYIDCASNPKSNVQTRFQGPVEGSAHL